MAAPSIEVRNAIETLILGLGLTGPGGGAVPVYKQFEPDETNVRYPNVTLTNRGLSDRKRQSTSLMDLIGYGCRVLIMDRRDRFDHSQMALYDGWRDAIANELDGLPLPGLSFNSVKTEVEEIGHGDPQTQAYQHLVHGLVVTALVWRTRGRTQ